MALGPLFSIITLVEDQEKRLHTAYDIQVSQRDSSSSIHSASSFEDLSLSEELRKGVYGSNFSRPSMIQAHALPLLLRDPPEHLIAQAQSGTGKTAAFSLAILSRIDYNIHSPQAIVLAPSRELARQIVDVMKQLAKYTQAIVTQVVPETAQRRERVQGHVIVGTPGKVCDMLKRVVPGDPARGPYIDASKVQMLVLDEADCMLDLQGLGQQIQVAKRLLPSVNQLVFFSATWDEQVTQFATDFVNGPSNKILLQTTELTLTTVKQFYIDCDNEEDRFNILVALYGIMTIAQSIIFVR
ncbi:RNA helicase required for poly(A+) mRNA export, partial [Mortierella claussenii]